MLGYDIQIYHDHFRTGSNVLNQEGSMSYKVALESLNGLRIKRKTNVNGATTTNVNENIGGELWDK
jgi:hypothetical protein